MASGTGDSRSPTAPPDPGAPSGGSHPPGSSRLWVILAVVAVAAVVVGAGVYYVYLRPTTPPAKTLEEGGFTKGQAVTFVYNGTNTFLCTPGISVMFPGNSTATAAGATTSCEVGNASQNAVSQVPEWVLVPAFAGLSVFGVAALGASSSGVPEFQGAAVGVDCGAGGTPTGCVDHPTYLYSPVFAAVERHIGQSGGYGGLPLGVLPTPSHDHVIDTEATFPNVQWGTIAVLVFDPNIWPSPATGQCTASVGSNLSNPTTNCLTSLSAIQAAFSTCSSAVATANANEPIWATLGQPCDQIMVPGALTVGDLMLLNANLYIPFAVQPGGLSTYPS